MAQTKPIEANASGDDGDDFADYSVLGSERCNARDRMIHGCEYSTSTCKITEERLAGARSKMQGGSRTSCMLDSSEMAALQEDLREAEMVGKRLEKAEVNEKRLSMPKHRPFFNLKLRMFNANLRARMDPGKDSVLGVQPVGKEKFNDSLLGVQPMGKKKFKNSTMVHRPSISDQKKWSFRKKRASSIVKEEEFLDFSTDDVSYVRKPDIAKIIFERDREDPAHRPKYTLSQVLLSRRFHLYKHRFANAQYERSLLYPTLPQPSDLYHGAMCSECTSPSEIQVSRTNGHRFIIAADTQFGILMDGYAMENPNWSKEIMISRKCVAKINGMTGKNRPLFVCICGDLVDTESSFSNSHASWKKVMAGWERNLVFEQQVKDFKRVWANLDPDIALVCLCGNHDVGNRPTKSSIERWVSAFGDEYFAFWVNGTYNIALNNCLFSNPTGAPDMFEEQLSWLEEKLSYAKAHDATHIFVFGHYPWFLKHEEEADDEIASFSHAPSGWGLEGSRFSDGYFSVPYKQRKMAMVLFRKYGVTACFSGHFHQNVVTQTSWGMPMIVTGPLSMTLESEILEELSGEEAHGIGIRIIDVGETGEFTHKWTLLDEEW